MLAPLAVRALLPDWLAPENSGGRALWMTAKWLVLGSTLQAMRKWGVHQMASQRATATPSGSATAAAG